MTYTKFPFNPKLGVVGFATENSVLGGFNVILDMTLPKQYYSKLVPFMYKEAETEINLPDIPVEPVEYGIAGANIYSSSYSDILKYDLKWSTDGLLTNGIWLYHALGSCYTNERTSLTSYTDTDIFYRHYVNVKRGGYLPSISLYYEMINDIAVEDGGSDLSLIYRIGGCQVKSLKITGKSNEHIKQTVEFVGAKFEITDATTDSTKKLSGVAVSGSCTDSQYPDNPVDTQSNVQPYIMGHATFTFAHTPEGAEPSINALGAAQTNDNADCYIEEFDLEITNEFKEIRALPSVHANNTFGLFVTSRSLTKRDYKLTFKVQVTDPKLIRYYYWAKLHRQAGLLNVTVTLNREYTSNAHDQIVMVFQRLRLSEATPETGDTLSFSFSVNPHEDYYDTAAPTVYGASDLRAPMYAVIEDNIWRTVNVNDTPDPDYDSYPYGMFRSPVCPVIGAVASGAPGKITVNVTHPADPVPNATKWPKSKWVIYAFKATTLMSTSKAARLDGDGTGEGNIEGHTSITSLTVANPVSLSKTITVTSGTYNIHVRSKYLVSSTFKSKSKVAIYTGATKGIITVV